MTFMDTNEYIKTFTINGQDIKLGLDDYGQCYFIEWEDEQNNVQTLGLGTYNFRYMEEIYYLFDPTYKDLSRKDLYGEELTDEEKVLWKRYKDLFEEEYKTYVEES